MRSVDVVIVNFRTRELALDAARSVLDEPETQDVIVVDNDSGDGSVEWLAEQEPRLKVLAAGRNLGFGGGNNFGAQSAAAPYLFLLNSDALLQRGGLAPLVGRMSDSAVGIVAPMVHLPNDELQEDALGRFPTPARILARQTDCSVTTLEPDWVTGAALLVRRSEFLALGGFDEAFFMYMEDVDLCRRYRARGARIVREPSSKVVHLGGASKTSSREQKALFRQSMDRYLQKHGYSAASRATVRAVRGLYSRLRRR